MLGCFSLPQHTDPRCYNALLTTTIVATQWFESDARDQAPDDVNRCLGVLHRDMGAGMRRGPGDLGPLDLSCCPCTW